MKKKQPVGWMKTYFCEICEHCPNGECEAHDRTITAGRDRVLVCNRFSPAPPTKVQLEEGI